MKKTISRWNDAGPGARYSVASRRREEPLDVSPLDHPDRVYFADNGPLDTSVSISGLKLSSSPFSRQWPDWMTSGITMRMFTRRPEEYVIDEHTLDGVQLSRNAGRFPEGGEA